MALQPGPATYQHKGNDTPLPHSKEDYMFCYIRQALNRKNLCMSKPGKPCFHNGGQDGVIYYIYVCVSLVLDL